MTRDILNEIDFAIRSSQELSMAVKVERLLESAAPSINVIHTFAMQHPTSAFENLQDPTVAWTHAPTSQCDCLWDAIRLPDNKVVGRKGCTLLVPEDSMGLTFYSPDWFTRNNLEVVLDTELGVDARVHLGDAVVGDMEKFFKRMGEAS